MTTNGWEYERIVAHIEAMVDMLGAWKKDAASAMGATPSGFSDKRVGRENHFSLEECRLLNEWASGLLGYPIPGWPLLSHEQARALGLLLKTI